MEKNHVSVPNSRYERLSIGYEIVARDANIASRVVEGLCKARKALNLVQQTLTTFVSPFPFIISFDDSSPSPIGLVLCANINNGHVLYNGCPHSWTPSALNLLDGVCLHVMFHPPGNLSIELLDVVALLPDVASPGHPSALNYFDVLRLPRKSQPGTLSIEFLLDACRVVARVEMMVIGEVDWWRSLVRDGVMGWWLIEHVVDWRVRCSVVAWMGCRPKFLGMSRVVKGCEAWCSGWELEVVECMSQFGCVICCRGRIDRELHGSIIEFWLRELADRNVFLCLRS
ncbi:hypothetical protein Tco_0046430 [Tanacetum coccineum]